MKKVLEYLLAKSHALHQHTGVCLFSDWEYSSRLTVDAAFPFDDSEWFRRCKISGKIQKWLPGYGGSEMGCWQTYRKEDGNEAFARAKQRAASLTQSV